MNLKNQITFKIAEILRYPIDSKSLKSYHSNWWANPRNKEVGGLKLTKDGFDQIIKAQIKFHKIRLENLPKKTNQMLIKLDQHINCPWYIWKNDIFVSDDKMAVQLILLSGNLERFIKSRSKKT